MRLSTILVLATISSVAFAQPTILATDILGTYLEYGLTDRGVVSSYQFHVTSAKLDVEWNFIESTGNYDHVWRPYSADQKIVVFNTKIDPSGAAASARYNTGSGGSGGRIDVNANRYYTWIVGHNATSDNFMSVIATSYEPVQILGVTEYGSTVYPDTYPNIRIALSGGLGSSEHLFVRYSTDDFSTSTITQVTSFPASDTGSFTFPAFPSSTNVKYYILTAHGTTPTESNVDYLSLKIKNIAATENTPGANYAYAVSNYATAQDGNWSSPSTWANAAVPLTNLDASSIVIAHNVVVDQYISVNNVVVNNGDTLTTSGTPIITFVDGGMLTVNGYAALTTGKTSFTNAVVSGSVKFGNVELNGGVDFGSSSTIKDTLVINSSGYVNTNAPSYDSASTLKYNSGGTYGRSLEWSDTSDAGYPYHVLIANNTGLNLKGDVSALRRCAGSLTIQSGSLSMADMSHPLFMGGDFISNGTSSLSTNVGGDLEVGGNWTNAGTFNANNRAVTFTGSSVGCPSYTQSGSGAFDYLTIATPNGLHCGSSITINQSLNLDSGSVFMTAGDCIIGSSGSIANASDSKHIDLAGAAGSLFRTAPTSNTTISYPVSADGIYLPVTINNGSGVEDVYSVKPYASLPAPVVDSSLTLKRAWKINEAVTGGSNVIFSVQWNDADEGSLFSAEEAYLGRYTGIDTAWVMNVFSVPAESEPFVGSNAFRLTGADDFQNTIYTAGKQEALPVELSTFSATVSGHAASLVWKTATEVNNAGWEVERKVVGGSGLGVRGTNPNLQSPNANQSWTKVAFVPGSGSSNAPHEYSFTDEKLNAGRYAYRLKQLDTDGKFTYSNAAEVSIQLSPEEYALSQNYPNPFNPSTTISFALQERAFVSLRVYNLMGQEVAVLVNEEREANTLQTVQFNASRLPSGVYYYSLHAGSRHESKKMLLLK